MAVVHTNLPERAQYGEWLVASFLAELGEKDLELWFNLDPNGVGEIDVIAVHKEFGVCLIEVKGHSINQIKHYDSHSVVMDRSTKIHPAKLVRNKAQNFSSLLKQLYRQSPYINSTVWWPQISRREWEYRFNSPEIDLDTDAMLFSGELQNEKLTFQKLNRLWEYPLRGAPISRIPNPKISEKDLNNLRTCLGNSNDSQKISEKLRIQIKRPVIDSTKFAARFPYGRNYNIEIQGPPGTGKTTKLREIGFLHSTSGADVLYVCFNKTLAAYMRREIRVIRDLGHGGIFRAIDIFDLMAQSLPEFNLRINNKNDSKEWENLKIEWLKNYRQVPATSKIKYDTVLIDEAQDMSSAEIDVIKEMTYPSSSWFVANGRGQEIYSYDRDWESTPCKALIEWRKSENYSRSVQQRPRSYRLSETGSIVSRVFRDTYPNLDDANKLLEKLLHKNSHDGVPTPNDVRNLSFDFGPDFQDYSEATGESLEIVPLPLRKNDSSKYPFVIDKLALESIVLRRVAASTDDEGHRELLILLKRNDSIHELLTNLFRRHKIDFLDLTDSENRRREPVEDTVVISGHQNSRGITGENVLIFDLEKISHTPVPLNNLLYISLSRSWRNCTIFMDARSESNPQINNFLKQILTTIDLHLLGVNVCENKSN